MAGKMTVYGLDELDSKLSQAGAAAQGIAKASLYEGARVMADAMHGAMESIQTEPFRWAKEGEEKRLPSPVEKAAVQAARFGVARHSGSGAEVNTVVGVAGSGYVDVAGKTRPAAMIIRSIESGTSFMRAQPVFRKAIRANKAKAASAIEGELDKRLQKLFKD